MLLRVTGLSKRYGNTPIFTGVGLELDAGECVALLGESGVGKSTLLNCIAALEPASAGEIHLDGQSVLALSEPAGATLRRERVGFVFQAFHLLPHLSVHDNVGLPLRLLGRRDEDRIHTLLQACELDGLGHRLTGELSGGQQQRVALARALVHRPALILADEPTGNLDPRQADRVLDLLLRLVRDERAACLLATHSERAAARADRRLRLLSDGCVAA
ncbi:MAG: ABC transporter ATP-binding protein [Aquabacterium sp.]